MSRRATPPWPGARPPPLRLAPGEHIVWEASPRWASFARRLFRLHWIALYGVLLTLADAVQARRAGLDAPAIAQAVLPGLLATAGGLLIFGLLAAGSARTARYTLTDRRLVLQAGLALPRTLSLPLAQIATVAVRLHRDGSGDITLRPQTRGRLSYLKLFPFARPWRLAMPEPMLRDAPAAGVVAPLLSRMVATARQAAPTEAPAAPPPATAAVQMKARTTEPVP